MDNTAKIILSNEIGRAINSVRKSFFEIIDDVRASDLDNYDDLVEILGDVDLAKKFIVFQENRNKAIRKKILDITGDMSRTVDECLRNYEIQFEGNIEFNFKDNTK